MERPTVWDIDGTLTAESYSPHNLASLKPNPQMISLALLLSSQGPLVVSTARPEKYRHETAIWLMNCGLTPDALYMRSSEDDGEPDSIVKEKHLAAMVKKFGLPKLWVDDKEENCNMAKNYGIPCILAQKPWKQ